MRETSKPAENANIEIIDLDGDDDVDDNFFQSLIQNEAGPETSVNERSTNPHENDPEKLPNCQAQQQLAVETAEEAVTDGKIADAMQNNAPQVSVQTGHVTNKCDDANNNKLSAKRCANGQNETESKPTTPNKIRRSKPIVGKKTKKRPMVLLPIRQPGVQYLPYDDEDDDDEPVGKKRLLSGREEDNERPTHQQNPPANEMEVDDMAVQISNINDRKLDNQKENDSPNGNRKSIDENNDKFTLNAAPVNPSSYESDGSDSSDDSSSLTSTPESIVFPDYLN